MITTKKTDNTYYDYAKLLGKIKEKGYTQERLAKEIGISSESMSMKLHSWSQFKQGEMIAILDTLEVPIIELPSYFYVKKLVKTQV